MPESGEGFDYLIVADLVATDEPGDKFAYQNQEVMEISWIVLEVAGSPDAQAGDGNSGWGVDERQLFVKPEWTSELSAQCVERTGLSTENLRESDNLQDAIHKFDSYINVNFVSNSKTFCLITDGPWGLKQCLRGEARAKGVSLDSHYSKYFDLRREFKRFSGVTTINSVKHMVDHLGVRREGARDSGIDKCRTMTNVVLRMIKDGHQFNYAEVVPESYNPATEPVDAASHGATQNHGASAAVAGDGKACVRLRGLPYSANEDEIVAFFEGLQIAGDGVHICKNHSGRATGEGFVRFEGALDQVIPTAMSKHRQRMGYRYIEVFQCSQDEMNAAMSGSTTKSSRTGMPIGPNSFEDIARVVKMRGLPFNATEKDIAGFFDGLKILPGGIQLVTSFDGRATGEAYVEFESEDIVREAMKKHRARMGRRYIELFRANKQDFNVKGSAPVATSGNQSSPNGEKPATAPAAAAATQGAAANAAGNSVSNPAPGSAVGAQPAPGGRSFNQPSQAGNYYMNPMNTAFVAPGGFGTFPVAAAPATNSKVPGPNQENLDENVCVRMRGLPFSATESDIKDFFSGLTLVSVHIISGPNERPTGDAFVEFPTSDVAQEAMKNHKGIMGQRYIELFRCTRNELLMALNMHPSQTQQQEMYMMQQPYPAQYQQFGYSYGDTMFAQPTQFGMGHMGMWGMAQHQQEPQAVVRMRGLPYRVTTPEVLEFFKDFSLNSDSVSFGQDREGRSNGEAFVTFQSYEEAERAVRTRNRQYIGPRYIELFLGEQR